METHRELLECRACRAHASVTAGALLHRSQLPLTLWFRAIWAITNQEGGASALGLQLALGLGSYRTTWICLHTLRRAMECPGQDPLTGEVEADEIFGGGVEKERSMGEAFCC